MPKRTLAGWLALLAVAALSGAGCHPGDVDDIGELDVVVTFYDENVDFGAFATFAMEDTIYNLAVLADPQEDDTLDRRFDADILDQVAAELQARGYTRVLDLDAPHDLRVGLGAFDVEGTLLYSYFPWWGYRPGAWYPAWGTVDFTKGSLLVFMADWTDRDDEAQEISPVWGGGLDGVIEGGNSEMRSRLQRGIAQMFIQSPYLKPGVTKLADGEVQR